MDLGYYESPAFDSRTVISRIIMNPPYSTPVRLLDKYLRLFYSVDLGYYEFP